MAALDFPSGPSNGQVWRGSNGVTYQWSSATTSWVAVGNAPAGSGDFMAMGNGGVLSPPLVNTAYVSIFNTVATGNAGGWYNPSNGRFTPPAGRYLIGAQITAYSTGSAVNFQIGPRKNGAVISNSMVNTLTTGANQWGTVNFTVEVDANGTDYFEVHSYTTVLWSGANGNFWAVPVGVVQSMAAPGTLQLWSEQVLTANAVEVVVSAPRNAKRYELQWISQCVSGEGSLYIQGIENGVPTQAGYHGQLQYSYGTNQFQSVARVNYPGLVGTGINWHSGTVRFAGYSAGVGGMAGDLTAWGQAADASSRYFIGQGFNTTLNPANITGFRLVNAGNSPLFVTGSFLRCYVVQDTVGAIVGNTGRSAFNVRATVAASYTGPGSANIFRSAVTPVVDYDPEGVWSVANAEFTAPATGRYQFSVTQHGDPASGGQYSGMVISHLTSAAAVIRNYAQPRVINTSGANSGMSVTQTLNMNAGEKVRFMLANPNAIAWAQHAEDATLITGGSTLTFASGFRIS